MPKTFFLFLAVMAALTLGAAEDKAETKDTRPVVKIGLCSSLTGEMAHFGESTVAWKNYALKKLQERGTKLRYEVFVEDDQMQGKQAILAARRMIELNKVNVLLTYSSPTGAAVAPLANERKVPHFAVAYNPACVVGDYSVSVMSTVDSYVPSFVELLAKKNYKRLAVFYVRNATWQPVYDSLKKLAEEKKIEIVFERIYMPGERDFRLGFQMLRQEKNVDAAVMLAWSPEINILARQYHEQEVKLPLVGLGGSYLMGGDRGKYFEGALDIYAGDLTETDRVNRELTGKQAFHPASLIYDQILITADIYEKYYAKNKKLILSQEFMAEVKKLKDYPSILGSASCLPNKFFSFQPSFYRIENGTFKVVKLEEL